MSFFDYSDRSQVLIRGAILGLIAAVAGIAAAKIAMVIIPTGSVIIRYARVAAYAVLGRRQRYIDA